MENKDFRSRLRNKKTTFNPEAWNQMAEMLDAMPEQKEEKKKRGGWLFFLGIFLAGILITSISFYVFNISDESEIVTATENAKNNEDRTTSKNEADNNSTQQEDIFNNKKITKSEKSQIIIAENLKPEQVSDQKASDDNSDNTKNISSIQRTDNRKKTFETKQNTDRIATQNRSVNTNQSETIATETIDLNNKIVPSSATSQTDQNTSDTALKIAANDEAATALQLLPTPTNIVDDSTSQKSLLLLDKKTSDLIQLPKVGRFYLTGTLGPAWFNGVNGYHINSGIFWDMNQLLGLETNLAYSTGWDKSLSVGETYYREQQIDLSALVHLNLYRRPQHKFSIELGGGYTQYWGNRIIGPAQPIGVRKSNGWNLQVGLSYTYFMRKKHGIGFKLGAISYDDQVNYFAVRYLYKF